MFQDEELGKCFTATVTCIDSNKSHFFHTMLRGFGENVSFEENAVIGENPN
jgi:hypothetical protein